jgi:hypothetical protein
MTYCEVREANIAAVDAYFAFWTYGASIGVKNQF